MPKPFERVERLPVPEDVAESFKKLRSAEMGRNLSGYGGGKDARTRATGKLAEAEGRAAGHFGGSVEKMRTHFKRWVRWGGRAMGVAEMLLPRESYERGMEEASDAMSKVPKRLRIKRKGA